MKAHPNYYCIWLENTQMNLYSHARGEAQMDINKWYANIDIQDIELHDSAYDKSNKEEDTKTVNIH